jgi:Predicted xylanase/chitin deacetylase
MIRNFARHMLISGLGHLGSARARRTSAILCLHSVTKARSDEGQVSGLTITDRFLERMIVDLRRQRISLVSLQEALHRVETGDTRPFVAITFDDGCRDNYDVAFPVLRQYEVPFAIFLTTGFVDRRLPLWWRVLEDVVARNSHVTLGTVRLPAATIAEKKAAFALGDQYFRQQPSKDIPLIVERLLAEHRSGLQQGGGYDLAVDWPMVREMQQSGLATFGGHTVSHPMLSRLTASEIAVEINECRDRLTEELGGRPSYFAYPYGQGFEVGSDAVHAVEKAGFKAAFATERRLFRNDDLRRRFQIPRISIDTQSQSETIIRAYLSGLPASIQKAVQSIRALPLIPGKGAPGGSGPQSVVGR